MQQNLNDRSFIIEPQKNNALCDAGPLFGVDVQRIRHGLFKCQRLTCRFDRQRTTPWYVLGIVAAVGSAVGMGAAFRTSPAYLIPLLRR